MSSKEEEAVVLALSPVLPRVGEAEEENEESDFLLRLPRGTSFALNLPL